MVDTETENPQPAQIIAEIRESIHRRDSLYGEAEQFLRESRQQGKDINELLGNSEYRKVVDGYLMLDNLLSRMVYDNLDSILASANPGALTAIVKKDLLKSTDRYSPTPNLVNVLLNNLGEIPAEASQAVVRAYIQDRHKPKYDISREDIDLLLKLFPEENIQSTASEET